MKVIEFSFQVNHDKYLNLSNGFKLTYQEGGPRNLFLGWAPTAIGYAAQGKHVLLVPKRHI
jgi:solute carrier family 25 phosphate transporter 3